MKQDQDGNEIGNPPADADLKSDGDNNEESHAGQISTEEAIRRRKQAAENAAKRERALVYEELGIEEPQAFIKAREERRIEEEAERTARQSNVLLQQELEELKAAKAAIERELQANRQTVFNTRVDSTIQGLAKDAKFPDDVVLWIRANSEFGEAVSFDDDLIDNDKLEGLIAKCKTARPSWFGSGSPGSKSNEGALPRTTTNKKGTLHRSNF